ncbi:MULTISPECIES: hypothetical protein [unclassified Microcoleus]
MPVPKRVLKSAVGLGLSLNAGNVDRTEGEDYEKAFGRWRLKQQVGQ